MALLADPDEPLMLADGSLLYPDGRVKRAQKIASGAMPIEVPSNSEAQRIVSQTRRTLVDLPTTPKASTPIAAVLAYVLFGLENTDIAIATGLSEKQVATIRMSDAFSQMHDAVVASMIENEGDNVRGLFAAASRAAAVRTIQLMDAEDEKVQLAAASSLLDRAGHRPADVLLVKGMMDSTMRIEYVEKKIGNDPLTIDMKGE